LFSAAPWVKNGWGGQKVATFGQTGQNFNFIPKFSEHVKYLDTGILFLREIFSKKVLDRLKFMHGGCPFPLLPHQ